MSQPQPIRNVLYIMCDQLRRDYLSCYGHPHLHTPNIDRLAAEGVRFARAYTQGTICGPSRMSSYTGRYVSSHQVSWNAVPLPLEELTLGDYLRPAGIRTALVGKTHATANLEGMQALGVDPQSERGQQLAEAGFEPYDRNDGIYPDGELFADKRESAPYTHYLRGLGYAGDNPWHDWANAAEGANGEVLSGWQMRNAGLPTRLPEPHSETVYATSRAIDFMHEQGDRPWCLHLSYIKPHWPYIAPAPYHALYGPGQVLPALRAAPGEESEHPVYKAFQQHQESLNFSREEVRNTVIPTYMGLIKQIDDQLGRLFEHMQSSGRWDDTLIVFTSDHGDYLGDHGLGEKEFLLEPAVGVPLLIRDPRAAARWSRPWCNPSTCCRPCSTPSRYRWRRTASRAVRCSRCCMGNGRRTGATTPSPNTTTPSRPRPASAWAGPSTPAACTWCAASAGSTWPTTASVRSCSTCRRTRASCATWAPSRPTRTCASSTSATCSTGCAA